MTIKEDFFFCPKCGAQDIKGAKTCSDCGNVFITESETELSKKSNKDYKKIIMTAGAAIGLILLGVLFLKIKSGGGSDTVTIIHDSVSTTQENNDPEDSKAVNDNESSEEPESIADSVADPTEAPPLAAPQFLTEFDGEIKADNPELCLVSLSGRIRDNYGNYYSNSIGGKTT